MKTQLDKYVVPVDIQTYQPTTWLPIVWYDYKLHANETGTKFTHLQFVDINSFIIGRHAPVTLQSLYNKATTQLKQNTVKAVSEIRQVVDGIADISVGAVSEVKDDLSKTANLAIGWLGRAQAFAANKLKRNSSSTTPESVETRTAESDSDLN